MASAAAVSAAARIPGRAARFAGMLVDVMIELLEASHAALYETTGGGLRLVYSQNLDQRSLEAAAAHWSAAAAALGSGMPRQGQTPRPYLLLPCLAGTRLQGVLYLECERRPRPAQSHVFGALLGEALSGLAGTPAQPARSDPADEIEAKHLLGLLERNEWNVSRVARILGVTRMTLYGRLRRFGLVRRRVRHTRPAGPASARSA